MFPNRSPMFYPLSICQSVSQSETESHVLPVTGRRTSCRPEVRLTVFNSSLRVFPRGVWM